MNLFNCFLLHKSFGKNDNFIIFLHCD